MCSSDLTLTVGIGLRAAHAAARDLDPDVERQDHHRRRAIATSLVCLWVDRNPDTPSSSASSRPLFARGEKLAVLSSASFWSIALPFALGVAVQVGVIAHLVSVLEPRMGRAAAGSAVALVSVSAFVGRFALSFVVDRLAPRSATSILLFVQAVSLGALSITDSLILIYMACIGFGIGVGNLITLPAIVIQRECEATRFGLVSGLVTATMGFTKPNSTIEAAICATWDAECVRAFSA